MPTIEQAARNLTPEELARVVKAFRETRQWSQEQLAEIAKLSARTVQRVEDAQSSSLDTRRALAAAFGFEDIDALNKPYVIPTPEQLQTEKERFEKEHLTLPAKPITSGKCLAELAELSSMDMFTSVFDMPREAEERFAQLTDYCREYRDCADLYSEVDKLGVYDELDGYLCDLAEQGVVICSASRRVNLAFKGNDNRMDVNILYVAACPKGDGAQQLIVPRAVSFR